MGTRRIAAAAIAVSLAVGFLPTVPAGARTERRVVPGPGPAFVHLADGSSATGAAESVAGERSPATATFVPPPNDDFVFHYGPEVSSSQRAVFEAAGGIWSAVLEAEVPIDVGVTVESFSDPGILGGAAPAELLADDPSFPSSGVWYASALANQFLGYDADPDRVEIDVLISSDYPFHEGVGGPVPDDRISLLTLALHELGHGLGHTTLARQLPDRTGELRIDGLPLAFDRLVLGADRVPLLHLAAADLGVAMTKRLLWGGPEAIKIAGGLLPEMFGPRVFQPGSSVSHLDEATYRTGSRLRKAERSPGRRYTRPLV